MDVSYPLMPPKGFELDDEIGRIVGKKSCSSGAGFGYRDIQFPFKRQEDAEKVAEKLRPFLKEKSERATVQVLTQWTEGCRCEECQV